jgi:hypothetical protein
MNKLLLPEGQLFPAGTSRRGPVKKHDHQRHAPGSQDPAAQSNKFGGQNPLITAPKT